MKDLAGRTAFVTGAASGIGLGMTLVRSSDCSQALKQRDRACNIDPPPSSYAIMRRACPYRGENSGTGKDVRGELDTWSRN
jgi:hypothetical protein